MNPDTNYMGGYAPAPQPDNGPSRAKKILIIVGGSIGLLSIILVIIALIFGGAGAKEQLTKVVSTQTEVARVATLVEDSRSAGNKTRNLAMIIRSTSQTNATSVVLDLENQYDTTLKSDKLNADLDETIDQKLASADQNNTYTATFESTISQLLNVSLAATNDALEANTNEQTEATLNNVKASTTRLLSFIADER